MSGQKLNAAMNVLQGVLTYNRNKQTHANDVAQQQVNNAVAVQQGQIAINALLAESTQNRRQLTFQFLEDQRAALAREGSASVQAAWAGIQGGTAQDIMNAVVQETARGEVARDENLRAIHQQATLGVAGIAAQTSARMDNRKFNKPDVLASILGIGQGILADNRKAGFIE